ncbi:DUF3631 domain-containing protein [Microbacterium bovistercoris]|uniref:DUF3631 domain-containing protein n=1 Tax=Microbacterium bovistercoris TaxID=2293570 RepID=A0A371NW66_9MICO|nr:DUF3631 domain-containing protein [Microbacterium bovistercoris]REJ06293.1 DUF3631 domain-containing protein [Microbacterium bovistercoris]
MSDFTDTSDGFDSSDGSLRGVLLDTVEWLSRYIVVAEQSDIEMLALWAAHTHLSHRFYTTPRLIIDSAMPGSGKTTVLEHLARLSHAPIQAASVSSAALISRLIAEGPRTILIDEADRSLDPKNPINAELLANINSGYKRGATRPVLVPVKGGAWESQELSTFAPVAMAGNAPHLPDDTRSRALRIVLMPDFEGRAEESDWEEIEPQAVDLGARLAELMLSHEEAIAKARPPMPDGCRGRAKERWAPLARIASVAGGMWPQVVSDLIERNLDEVTQELNDGLAAVPPAVSLVTHIHQVWPDAHDFMRTGDLINLLVNLEPLMWGDASSYGKRLTAQRLGRMLSQAFKIHSTKRFDDQRGYQRSAFELVWRRFGLGVLPVTVGTVEPVGSVGGAA